MERLKHEEVMLKELERLKLQLAFKQKEIDAVRTRLLSSRNRCRLFGRQIERERNLLAQKQQMMEQAKEAEVQQTGVMAQAQAQMQNREKDKEMKDRERQTERKCAEEETQKWTEESSLGISSVDDSERAEAMEVEPGTCFAHALSHSLFLSFVDSVEARGITAFHSAVNALQLMLVQARRKPRWFRLLPITLQRHALRFTHAHFLFVSSFASIVCSFHAECSSRRRFRTSYSA
jgi:hypothetical protein